MFEIERQINNVQFLRATRGHCISQQSLIDKNTKKCFDSNSNYFNAKCPVPSTEITTVASFLPQEPIKRKDPLPPLGLKPAEVNKAPLPKGKTPVLPDISKAQQRAPRRAGDLVSVPDELVR